MSSWTTSLFSAISDRLHHRPCWQDTLRLNSSSEHAIHLAVFIEPTLQFVLDGKKKVESRFSLNRCAPYKAVDEGDLILIKRSGGPIVAVAEVSEA